MKTTNNLLKAAVLAAVLSFSANAQDKAKFLTDNGSKEVTEVDCASLTELQVKTNIPASAFKFDNIDVTIEINMNQKFPGSTLEEIYVYGVYYNQKKFSILYEGKKEMSFWLASPKDGFGDFTGDDGKIRSGVLCGSTLKEKVDIKFSVYGYVKTGEKEVYNESTKTWEKVPLYDEGVLLSEAALIIKQTPENMAAAKKAKMKRRFGLGN